MALNPVHFFKCFKNPVGAWIDRDGRAIAPENLPLLVDDEQSPFANPFAFAIGAILLCDGAFRFKVGKQRKMQVTVVCECRMAPVAIARDPKKLVPVIVKLGQDLVVERHLIAADRTPIGGIEGKNDHLSARSLNESIWSGVTWRLNPGAAVPGRRI